MVAAPKPRVDAFDGLRGIAIMLVVWWHAHYSPGFPQHGWWLLPLNGGVTIFLVLSGFLNTRSLLSQEAREGRFSVPDFWLRMWMRLHPPMLVYLLFILLVSPWLTYAPTPGQMLKSALFLANLDVKSPYVAHLWSMATQAQFWLFWPCLLLVCPTRLRLPLVGLLLLWAGVGPGLYGRWFPAAPYYHHTALFSFGPMAAGAALALIEKSPRAAEILAWLSRHAVLVALLAVGAFALTRTPGFWLSLISADWGAAAANWKTLPAVRLFSATLKRLLTWGALVALDYLLLVGRPAVLTRLLTLPPLVYLGRWSFSIYLWQNFFLLNGIKGVGTFPLNLVTCVVVGYVAYRLVEKPFIDWRGGVIRRGRSRSQSGDSAVAARSEN